MDQATSHEPQTPNPLAYEPLQRIEPTPHERSLAQNCIFFAICTIVCASVVGGFELFDLQAALSDRASFQKSLPTISAKLAALEAAEKATETHKHFPALGEAAAAGIIKLAQSQCDDQIQPSQESKIIQILRRDGQQLFDPSIPVSDAALPSKAEPRQTLACQHRQDGRIDFQILRVYSIYDSARVVLQVRPGGKDLELDSRDGVRIFRFTNFQDGEPGAVARDKLRALLPTTRETNELADMVNATAVSAFVCAANICLASFLMLAGIFVKRRLDIAARWVRIYSWLKPMFAVSSVAAFGWTFWVMPATGGSVAALIALFASPLGMILPVHLWRQSGRLRAAPESGAHAAIGSGT